MCSFTLVHTRTRLYLLVEIKGSFHILGKIFDIDFQSPPYIPCFFRTHHFAIVPSCQGFPSLLSREVQCRYQFLAKVLRGRLNWGDAARCFGGKNKDRLNKLVGSNSPFFLLGCCGTLRKRQPSTLSSCDDNAKETKT